MHCIVCIVSSLYIVTLRKNCKLRFPRYWRSLMLDGFHFAGLFAMKLLDGPSHLKIKSLSLTIQCQYFLPDTLSRVWWGWRELHVRRWRRIASRVGSNVDRKNGWSVTTTRSSIGWCGIPTLLHRFPPWNDETNGKLFLFFFDFYRSSLLKFSTVGSLRPRSDGKIPLRSVTK